MQTRQVPFIIAICPSPLVFFRSRIWYDKTPYLRDIGLITRPLSKASYTISYSSSITCDGELNTFKSAPYCHEPNQTANNSKFKIEMEILSACLHEHDYRLIDCKKCHWIVESPLRINLQKRAHFAFSMQNRIHYFRWTAGLIVVTNSFLTGIKHDKYGKFISICVSIDHTFTYSGRPAADTFQHLIEFPCITASRRPLGLFRNCLPVSVAIPA